MKELIIAASDNYTYETLQYWVNSIQMGGFSGDIAIIAFNMDGNTVSKLRSKGVMVYALNEPWEDGSLSYRSDKPVHVERFFWISEVLKEIGSNYRYTITTDIKDVIFQINPSPHLERMMVNYQLVIGSEGLRYCDEPWGNQNLLETFGERIYDQFKEKEIYNVGVLAGLTNSVQALCFNIYLSAINRPIPICDQSTFNVMMHTEPYASIVQKVTPEDSWVVHMGTTNDPSKERFFDPLLLYKKPMILEDDWQSYMHWVENSEGEKFTIVHQYDRNPKTKADFIKYYKEKE